MDWVKCSKGQEVTGFKSRFDWPHDGFAGFNCESGVTISDIGGALSWLWTFPSDWVLRIPAVAEFLELDPLHTGGWWSAGLTFAAIYATIAIATAK